MNNIPFQFLDWDQVPKEEHLGENGISYWQTMAFGGLRLRLVEYSAGYLADHWCQKGHIVYCVEGSFDTHLETGECITLNKGMMYIVSDDMSSHRSHSKQGVKLFIIDGDFLSSEP
jgi:hypothetical protein